MASLANQLEGERLQVLEFGFFSLTRMPTARDSHSCGLVTNIDQGHEIVVAGGYGPDQFGYVDTVDIYTINIDSWREGNSKFTPS